MNETDDRCHIEITRNEPDDRFNATFWVEEGCDADDPADLSITDHDILLVFDDLSSVRLVIDEDLMDEESCPNDLFDVYVNDIFTHTCAFKGRDQAGTLLHVFKEQHKIKIAPSSESLCIPSFDRDRTYDYLVKEKKGRRRKATERKSALSILSKSMAT